MPNCPFCNEDLIENVRFCPACGKDVSKIPFPLCSSCGAELIQGKKFCNKCGVEIKPVKSDRKFKFILPFIVLFFAMIFTAIFLFKDKIFNRPFFISASETPVISKRTPTHISEIISSVKEVHVSKETPSLEQKGVIVCENLTLEIPVKEDFSDSEIKVVPVSINKIDNVDCYKISTDDPDKVIDLHKPVRVKINTAEAISKPVLALWSGYEWLPVDSSYDPESRELSIELDCIYKDINEWTTSEGELGFTDGPFVLGVLDGLTYYSIVSNEGHFKVFYSNKGDKSYAESLANTFEKSYEIYKGLVFNPADFVIRTVTDIKYDFICVYLIEPDSEIGGNADPRGFIRVIKELDSKERELVASHELFHLIQFNYNNRCSWPDWMGESTADAMGFYVYNRINSEDFYDYSPIEGDRFRHWDGEKSFTYSLDSEKDIHHPYQNFIFWSYFIKKYGINKFRPFVIDSFIRNLSIVNDKCKSVTGKSLDKIYSEALEDYYVYGKVFNKSYFSNFTHRPPGQPFSLLENRHWAFAENLDNNPYYNSREVNLECLSGKCLSFYSYDEQGKFCLSITEKPDTVKVKLYYFKKVNNKYQLIADEELTDVNINKVVDNFGTDITDIYVLMENTSLIANKTIKFKACIEKSEIISEATWKVQNNKFETSLNDVYFIDSQNGWAVGISELILHTSDGGNSWIVQHSNGVTFLYGIHFLDRYNGWVAGDGALVFHTIDGGENWELINDWGKNKKFGSGRGFTDIYFSDYNNGWITGYFGEILHTSDGGKYWYNQYSGINEHLRKIYFINSSEGWIAGDDANILHTTDGGAKWELQYNRSSMVLNDIFFIDSQNGWAVGGGDANILHTSNGGNTWYIQSKGEDYILEGVHFVNLKEGWAVGGYLGEPADPKNGVILHTTDGGLTWKSKYIKGEHSYLNAVDFIDSEHGWAVGLWGIKLIFSK